MTDERERSHPDPDPASKFIAQMQDILDRVTTKVICHPDRAEALRAAIAAADPPLPLVRVVESPYVPDPTQAYVFRPPAGLYPTVGEP